MLQLILYLLLIFILLIFLIFMSVYGFSLIVSSMYGAPYVPTKNMLTVEILKEIKFKKNSLFVELGSGDGRIVRTAVRLYGVKGIGVDINPLLTFWANCLSHSGLSRIKKRFWSLRRLAGPQNDTKKEDIHFVTDNILNVDLTKADYIYLFLFPALIQKLLPKFNKELKKGTIIISHGFPIEKYKKKLTKKVKRATFPTYYYKI